ncbi:MAG: diguanylate cyclase [Gammaproteobacteria bacterium]|nr:diguanylate cyclase [Gammaproteobacteria bacterium]
MIKPAIPSNESQRLQTLRDLNLLDTPPEERFDRVTRLAKQVFSTDIALVSLVDADRQWFKSRQGLDAEETPRDISFCGHAILGDDIMVVNNAEKDQRFCDNPLVCGDPNIRFYAGYPLAAPDGSRIGTLCVIDDKPKEISTEQLQLLRELGRMVEEELIAANNSTNDAVTGISNRNGFIAIANHLLPMCRRKEQPATLLLFDVQNLQEIEQQAGRTEADTTATELAHMLMASFRDSDIVARVSFNVFCVLLAGADLDGADPARYRFDKQLSEHNRDPSCQHEILIEAHAVAYKEGRHADAAALLQDGEVRIIETDPASEEVA